MACGKRHDDDFVAYVTGRLPVLRRVAAQLAGDAHRGDDLVQQAITRLYHPMAAHQPDRAPRCVRVQDPAAGVPRRSAAQVVNGTAGHETW